MTEFTKKFGKFTVELDIDADSGNNGWSYVSDGAFFVTLGKLEQGGDGYCSYAQAVIIKTIYKEGLITHILDWAAGHGYTLGMCQEDLRACRVY